MNEKIDWAMLRSQKLTLIQVIGIYNTTAPTVAEDLQGILHLIDAMQDEAAQHLGDDIVFGE
jgi:hypothetical protein